MRAIRWLGATAAVISVAAGGGPAEPRIAQELVESLSQEIRALAQPIYDVLQVYPHFQPPLLGESQHAWEAGELEPFFTFLDHVEQAVEYELRYPKSVSKSTLLKASPSCHSKSPDRLLKLLTLLFGLSLRKDEQDGFIKAFFDRGFGVNWTGSSSNDVLPSLVMIGGRIERLQKDAIQAIEDSDSALLHNRHFFYDYMPASSFKDPWLQSAKMIRSATELTVGLCKSRSLSIWDLVGSMSEDALFALQAQVAKYAKDAAEAFRVLYEKINNWYPPWHGVRGEIKPIMRLVMDTLLPDRDVLAGELCAAERAKEFMSTLFNFALQHLTHIIKLGELSRSTCGYYYSGIVPDNEEPSTVETAMERFHELQQHRTRLQEVVRKLPVKEALDELYRHFRIFDQLLWYIEHTLALQYGVRMSIYASLTSEGAQFLKDLCITSVDLLRLLDQTIERTFSDEPDELRRHHLLIQFLLPIGQSDKASCGLRFIMHLVNFLQLLEGKVDVPEDYGYDLAKSPLMQHFPPT